MGDNFFQLRYSIHCHCQVVFIYIFLPYTGLLETLHYTILLFLSGNIFEGAATFWGIVTFGGPLLLGFNRRVKNQCYFRGGRYFRNSTVIFLGFFIFDLFNRFLGQEL